MRRPEHKTHNLYLYVREWIINQGSIYSPLQNHQSIHCQTYLSQVSSEIHQHTSECSKCNGLHIQIRERGRFAYMFPSSVFHPRLVTDLNEVIKLIEQFFASTMNLWRTQHLISTWFCKQILNTLHHHQKNKCGIQSFMQSFLFFMLQILCMALSLAQVSDC
jgi:hypothetical protein